MKMCADCGASNADLAKFCIKCGRQLTAAVKAGEAGGAKGIELDDDALVRLLRDRAGGLRERKADVLFVLDCTGSMQGEIDAVKDAITDFADSIESEGVRARVGLIAFRDRLVGEEAEVLTFDGEPFTDDAAAFRRGVTRLYAGGGLDEPESSLDAMMLAVRQPFAPDASKVIVLVTDAPPHVPDLEVESVEEVAEAIRAAGIDQVYLVVRTQDPQSQIYLKLLERSRGMAFELGEGDDFRSRAENFKRTLTQMGKTISTATR